MINHARTLLLNIAGRADFVNEVGEEIIPATYLPTAINGAISRVRSVLFGANPDRAMLNYRSRQLLNLVHQYKLEQFVLDLDPRVTYSFDDDPFADRTLYDAKVTQTVGNPRQLAYVGEAIAPDSGGVARMRWLITIESAGNVETRLLTPLLSQVQAFTITGGVSQLIPLPGSTSSIRFQEPAVGDRWELEILSRPQADLGTILATLDLVGDDAIADVFATTTPAGQAEPIKTFRNLWNDHHELGMRLGALTLSLIYRTEALRKVA